MNKFEQQRRKMNISKKRLCKDADVHKDTYNNLIEEIDIYYTDFLRILQVLKGHVINGEVCFITYK